MAFSWQNSKNFSFEATGYDRMRRIAFGALAWQAGAGIEYCAAPLHTAHTSTLHIAPLHKPTLSTGILCTIAQLHHCTDLSFALVFFAQCIIAQTFTFSGILCTLHKPTRSTAQCFPFHKTQHFSIVVQWNCERGGFVQFGAATQ